MTSKQTTISLSLCIFLLQCSSGRVTAQEARPTMLTLEIAVELAQRNYPAIRVAQAQAAAIGGEIDLARNAYLPRLEVDWQNTRGTRNNVFGQFFPQTAIPPISGPLLANSSFSDSAWGSGGGIILSWEPFDFGLRKAGVELADRLNKEGEARVAVTRLDVATAAADAFLKVVAATQAVNAAQGNVDRMEAFSGAVHVLVDNQLRPGVDASRTDAEMGAARNALIQAKQLAALASLALAEAVGLAGQTIEVQTGPLLEPLPVTTPTTVATPANDLSAHPLALNRKASLDIILARQKVLDRSFFPRFNWHTALFGRGSGARVDGSIFNTHGFYPDTANWATGLTITFTPSDFFNLRSRRRQETNYFVAEQARYDQTLQQLKTEEATAKALFESAKEFADNAPRQLQAAQETELRVRKRYEAELGTVTDVAEAQRLLTQAEVASALARLSLWRARLAEARAKGDLKPFLDLIHSAGQKRD